MSESTASNACYAVGYRDRSQFGTAPERTVSNARYGILYTFLHERRRNHDVARIVVALWIRHFHVFVRIVGRCDDVVVQTFMLDFVRKSHAVQP